MKSQISKGMIVQLVSDFLLWTWFIILKPMDTNCPCRISKVFGSKFTDLCVLTPSFLYTLLLCSRHVRGHSTLRDPICSSFVCCFSRTLYSLSVPGKQERAELHTAVRTEIMRSHLFGFLSVTPFSDLFSYALLMQDIECFLAL